jgi:hypothetical protein
MRAVARYLLLMSLLVAVPCGIGAAIAYGASTAVEHSAAHSGTAANPTGPADPRGLIALLHSPRWILGMAGDTVGLVLQVIALATGPVVLIQPLLVLALPISLPIGWSLGGRRPTRADYGFCALIIAGLGGFFAIVGDPGDADVLKSGPALITVLAFLVAGTVACLAARSRVGAIRALIYGGVAGAWFGLVGVLLDASATAWRAHGIDAFGHADGLVPLIGLVVLGGLSIALTQLALQIGELSASFPANLSADPVVAVALGAALLHENVPAAPGQLVAYAACLAAVVVGAIRLARPADR